MNRYASSRRTELDEDCVRGAKSAVAAFLVTLFLLVTCATVACCSPGCSLFTAKNVTTALTDVQIACVFESEVSDSSALAAACGIADAAIPLIEELIAERDGARKAGTHWGITAKDPKDAGHE